MLEHTSITLAIGIALSLLYTRRTGFPSGGLISPGIVALAVFSPNKLAFAALDAAIVWAALEIAVRRFGLFGRERIGAAMLLSLLIRIIAAGINPAASLGWVVPGLIAADVQKYGVVETVASLAIVSCATFFVAQILFVRCGI